MAEGASEQERTVRAVLAGRGHRPGSLTLIGAGLDHAAYVVDGQVVVRVATGADRDDQVRREAELLRRVAAVSTVPVPLPLWTEPESGCLAYRRLPGRPLLRLPDATASASAVGAQLGRLLARLHGQPPGDWSDVVCVEHPPLEAWLAQAREDYTAVTEHVPVSYRCAVEAFLGGAPPQPDATPVLCHNDLGIEHVLVDGGGVVTGILDWSDAAVTDPSRDLALVYRDLGRPALQAALGVYSPLGAEAGLLARARYYARCALLEDLAHGLRSGQHPYTAKSLAGLAWLFSPLGS